MANETLYGCVTWPGGVVSFDQYPDCTYNGCIEWTGIHAGQVAVTVSTDECDDIYYGCVDWSTGKFEVSVPEDCCTHISYKGCTQCFCFVVGDAWVVDTAYSPGANVWVVLNSRRYVCEVEHTSTINDRPGSGANWDDFWERVPNTTPKTYTLVISGVSLCSGGCESRPDVNGTYVLCWNTRTDGEVVGGAAGTCLYEQVYDVGGTRVNYEITLSDETYSRTEIKASTGSGAGARYHYRYEFSRDENCVIASGVGMSNKIELGNCGGYNCGYGGHARWYPGGTLQVWNAGTTYRLGSFVIHEGLIYRGVTLHSNQEPPNETYWNYWEPTNC